MATTLARQLVLDALNMALVTRRPRGVIHHSDQGSQYTSIEFGHRCREAGVRPSMGSVGDAYDNAMCESFFATLECELLARCRFKTPAEARRAVFAFIEGFYNPRRRHSSIEYLSPIDYERRHYAMIVVPDDDQPAAVLAAVNRDRGASRDAAPPTPPGIRVRTTAVRRIRSGQRSPWRPVRDRGSEPSRSRDVAPRSC